jgi:hypothetical protein
MLVQFRQSAFPCASRQLRHGGAALEPPRDWQGAEGICSCNFCWGNKGRDGEERGGRGQGGCWAGLAPRLSDAEPQVNESMFWRCKEAPGTQLLHAKFNWGEFRENDSIRKR